MKNLLKISFLSLFFIGLFTILSGNSLSAQTKTIDLRTYSERNGNTYYLVFTASKPNGGTGHAFITFGKQDRRARQSEMASYGLYGTGEISILGKMSGEVRREADYRYNYRNSAKLIVKVNKRQLDMAYRVVSNYSAKGNYKILTRDCAEMVLTAAKTIGLKTPRRNLFRNAYPYTMLTSLISAN